MSGSVRERLTRLHTWAGLTFGWLLFAIFLMGSLAVFSPEITHWMQPEAQAGPASPRQAIAAAQAYLQREAPHAERWSITLPSARDRAVRLSWTEGFDDGEAVLDPSTAKRLRPRATEGGEFFNRVHYELHAGMLGLWFVGFAGLVLFVMIISGVIIHRRIFADFFTFRPKAAAQRAWLDGHNLAGVMTLPFLLMIAYSGVSLSYAQFMPASIDALYGGDRGAPDRQIAGGFQRETSGMASGFPDLPFLLERAEATLGRGKAARVQVAHPGDRDAVFSAQSASDERIAALGAHVALDAATGRLLLRQDRWNEGATFHRTLRGLHFGAYGGPVVAWLYFLSGLTGCVLIAAGLIVFVEKRRKKRAEAAAAERLFHQVAERINVAAVAGVMLAAICFLWGNRLVAADLGMREVWEDRIFFVTWAVALLHALIRPPRQAWIEQLATTAALCLALPALDAATSNAGLWCSLPAGDWRMASVDLTAAALGLAIALIAARLVRGRPT